MYVAAWLEVSVNRRWITVALLMASCVTANDMWMPTDSRMRASKPSESVVLLENEPTERPFEVIGVITPPMTEYDSLAQAVNAARRIAASKGADAVFLDKSAKGVVLKAIAWK